MPRPRKANTTKRIPSDYIVLADDGGDKQWIVLGAYQGFNQRDAKLAALRDPAHEHYRMRAEDGGVVLVCIPKRSWKPKAASLKQREPVLVV